MTRFTLDARGAMTRLKPLTPERLRYVGWFIAAGWGLRVIAELFDLDELELGRALPRRAA